MQNLFVLFGTVLFMWSAYAQSSKAVQWKVQDGGNGHWYELVGDYEVTGDGIDMPQRWTWPTAKRMAETLGGHLVTITSQAEQDFVAALHATKPKPTWIGLTDSETYGGHESFGLPNSKTNGWVWVTGEPVVFTSWLTGSPDQTRPNEDGVVIGSQSEIHHLWNDEQLTDTAPFIVEWDSDLFIKLSLGQIQLSWSSIPGNVYRIEQSSNMKSWKAAARVIALDEVTIFAPVKDALPNRFFRLVRE